MTSKEDIHRLVAISLESRKPLDELTLEGVKIEEIKEAFNARLTFVQDLLAFYDLDPSGRDAYVFALGLEASEELEIGSAEINDMVW